MSDDVGYVENGPQGKTCLVCKNFEPDKNNSAVGKCMGHEVSATASCNYFEPKVASSTPVSTPEQQTLSNTGRTFRCDR